MLMKTCAKPRSYHKYRIQPKNLTSCSCAYVLRAPEPGLPTSENFELFSIQYYMAKSTQKNKRQKCHVCSLWVWKCNTFTDTRYSPIESNYLRSYCIVLSSQGNLSFSTMPDINYNVKLTVQLVI